MGFFKQIFIGGGKKKVSVSERAQLARACLRSITINFSNPSNIDVVKSKMKEFLALSRVEQARIFGKSYFRHETYLVKFGARAEVTTKSLRAYVVKQYPELQYSAPFDIFLKDEAEQEFAVCRYFLLRLVANAHQMSRFQTGSLNKLDKWLLGLPDKNAWPPPLPSFHEDSPQNAQEWVKVLEGFNTSIYIRLKRVMGHSQAVGAYEKAFEETSDNYKGLDAFPVVCGMLPNILMDDERLGLLAGRKQLIDKLDRLQATHQELSGAYHSLQKAQKQLEGARHSSKEDASLVMTLLDTAGEAIFGLDEDGSILMANRVALVLWELSEEGAVNAPFLQLLTDASRALFLDAVGNIRSGNKREDWLNLDGVKTSGEIFPLEMRAQPTEHSDLCITLAIRDLSEAYQREARSEEMREKLERAERMESIGLLAGGVAHDLNNILGPMVAYPDLILETMAEENEFYEDVLEMGSSAKRAAAIIQDLLTMSRRGHYQFKPVSLSTIVRKFLCSPAFKNPFAQSSNLTMQVNLDDDCPLVMGSEHHIIKILMNLCINALDAMPAGGLLDISTTYLPDDASLEMMDANNDQGVVECRIRDTGEGIPQEHLNRIFEPFYTTKNLGRSGSGLGLSAVYGVIQDLGGQMDVRSTVGIGTEFVIKLPAVFGAAEEKETMDVAPVGRERILIVDDETSQLKLAFRLLKSLGYRVFCMPHGQAAIDFLHQEEVDLVLLDMMMADGFDGLDTYRVIHVRWPQIPCLIASGFSESDRVKESIRLGACGFLPKPYPKRELAFAVRRALDGESDDKRPRKKLETIMPEPPPDLATRTPPSHVQLIE
jgi:PAS domain S-box-containing protein